MNNIIHSYGLSPINLWYCLGKDINTVKLKISIPPFTSIMHLT